MGTTGEVLGREGADMRTRGDLFVCGARGPYVWVRDVGNDPTAGEGPQGFPPLVVTADGGHGPQTLTEWNMSCNIL